MADAHASWSQAAKSRATVRRRLGGRRRRVLARCAVLSIIGFVSLGMFLTARSIFIRAWTIRVSPSDRAPAAGTATGLLNVAALRSAAAKLDPDLQQIMPASIDPKYKKTPCWQEAGKLQCLPSFLLAGNFQSGGEALTVTLAAHPDIKTGASSNSQFWAEWGKPAAEYIAGLPANAVKQAPAGTMIMDSSLSTWAHYWSAGTRAHSGFRNVMEACWRNCSETAADGNDAQRDACVTDRCFAESHAEDSRRIADAGLKFDDAHVPLLLHAAYRSWPVKLVVLLRNPIQRLAASFVEYGHYKSHYGDGPEGFQSYVTESLDSFDLCAQKHRQVDLCALNFESLGLQEEKLFFHADQFIRGLHSIFAERWLAHVPRERLLAIKSEAFDADPEGVTRQVFEFLGVTTDSAAAITAQQAGGPPILTKPTFEIPSATLERLQRFYSPFNEQLARILGDPSFLEWNRR